MADIESSERRSNAPQTIRAEIFGDDTAEACGVSVKSNAPGLELCRQLIAEGYDPGTRLECFRGDMLCVIVANIGKAATLAVDENRMAFRKWEPFSRARVASQACQKAEGVLFPRKWAREALSAALP